MQTLALQHTVIPMPRLRRDKLGTVTHDLSDLSVLRGIFVSDRAKPDQIR